MAGVKGKSGRKTAAAESSKPKTSSITSKAGNPTKPKWLPKDAEKYFRDILKFMRLQEPCQLTVIDGIAVGQLAVAMWRNETLLNDMARLQDAGAETLEIETVIEILRSQEGISKGIKEVAAEIKYWCDRLYLDPMSRVKSKVPAATDADEEKGYAKLIKMFGDAG